MVAKRFQVTPGTIHNYIKKFPCVQQAVATARGRLTDFAESKLFEAIARGESWAITFYLKTQGKARGYVERVQVEADPASSRELTPLTLEDLRLDIEVRKALLDALRARTEDQARKQVTAIEAPSQPASDTRITTLPPQRPSDG